MAKKLATPKKLRTAMVLPRVMKVRAPSKDAGKFPLDSISYSKLVKFSSNPILFKVEALNGDQFDTASSISSVIGRAGHKALEVYSGGSDTLVPSNESEAIEYGLKAGMEFLDMYNDAFIRYTSDIANKQRAFDLMSFGFQTYVKEKPYKGTEEIIEIEAAIEEHISVTWRGVELTLPVPLKGRLDKVVREDGKIKIKDWKFVRSFSDPEKIDGQKMLQAVEYYLLAYAKYGEEPYSMVFEEIKMTKNKEGGSQIREYEMVYAESDQIFDFYFRFYEDMIRAINGEAVWVPNIHALYDNEVAIIAYIHRLDVSEEQAKLMKKHKVDNVTDLLKKKIQSAGNMRRFLKTVEKQFISAKSLDYSKMKAEEKIQTKLMEHGMMVQFDSLVQGATFDLYRYTPSIGLKMARLAAYTADVEQVLGISGIRVLAPIPDSTHVGFEVPRRDRSFPALPSGSGFEIAIGQDVEGNDYRFDIRKAPHMLVAGASGSGKSVFLSSVIEQLARISNADLHLADPKMVELSRYKAAAVQYASEPEEILAMLKQLIQTMNGRYKKFADVGARNIDEYGGSMKYKFVVIDEFGDLPKIVQPYVLKLAQKARAAGIHLILATQRPSVDIITGTIKANFPVKVAFRMAKAIDSVVLLDEPGAEKLMGRGDMIFQSDYGKVRLQGYSV